MLIVKSNSMPRLWWLVPWSYARQLYRNCVALKALCDRQDDTIRLQAKTITDLKKNSEYERVYKDVVETLKNPELDRGKPIALFKGEAYLYDPEAKHFAYETDAAKAIERVNELNR